MPTKLKIETSEAYLAETDEIQYAMLSAANALVMEAAQLKKQAQIRLDNAAEIIAVVFKQGKYTRIANNDGSSWTYSSSARSSTSAKNFHAKAVEGFRSHPVLVQYGNEILAVLQAAYKDATKKPEKEASPRFNAVREDSDAGSDE